MRHFGTYGPVNKIDNYVVARSEDLADFIRRIKLGRYIIETKIWRSEQAYQAGKQQLTAYLKLERQTQGYYIVFDHRRHPNPKVETEVVDGCTIHSYVIPVLQDTPSISAVSG